MAGRRDPKTETGPAEAELAVILGRATGLWNELRGEVVARFKPVTERWTFSAKTGRWSLRLQQARTRRTVLYLIAHPGRLQAGFALGEKACRAARASELPPQVLEVIEAAPRYAEGRGVWLEVPTRKAVGEVLTLAAIKMAN